MQKTPHEVIHEALFAGETAEPGLQPAVLMHRDINHAKVAEYTSCYVNEPHQDRLTGLINDGWIVFRIQTEFTSIGHMTMAYLAKMKVN